MLVSPRTALKAVLAALKAESGLLDGATLHLFQSNVLPNVNTVVGDLEEADFSGYAESAALVFGTAFNTPNGAAIAAPSVQFTATASTVTNDVYGYYIMSGEGTPQLLYVERFSEPKSIGTAGDVLIVAPIIALEADA